jgi:hypothetical protein
MHITLVCAAENGKWQYFLSIKRCSKMPAPIVSPGIQLIPLGKKAARNQGGQFRLITEIILMLSQAL